MQPKGAVGFDWQNVLSNELRALKDAIGCTLVVLIHENKEGKFYGSNLQRAAWDRALHVTEGMNVTGKGKEAVKTPNGKRYIGDDKNRDGEKQKTRDVFTLVSRLLGRTPSGQAVTSALVKWDGVARIDSSLAVDDDIDEEVSEAVERETLMIKAKDDTASGNALGLVRAVQEDKENRFPNETSPIWYTSTELRLLFDDFRVKRCIDSRTKRPLAPLTKHGKDAQGRKRIETKAFERTLEVAMAEQLFERRKEGPKIEYALK